MRYAIVLAFGAVALAQNFTQSPTQSCIDVVTETSIQYFTATVCPPCNSTTTTVGGSSSTNANSPGSLTTSSISSITSSLASGSSASTTVVIGTNSDDGPIFISTSISTGTTTTTVAPPVSATGSTTTTTSSTQTPTPSPSGTPGGVRQISISSLGLNYVDAILFAHNLHRQNASIVNLVWNQQMADYAQQAASTCVYEHNRNPGQPNGPQNQYGQNIGAGFVVSGNTNQVPAMITNNMYNDEINDYPGPYGADNIDTSNFAAWGHYSQIVWRDTTSVGCATQYCPNGLANTPPGTPPYFTVCNYYPAGNYVGLWSRVAAPGGGETVVFTP